MHGRSLPASYHARSSPTDWRSLSRACQRKYRSELPSAPAEALAFARGGPGLLLERRRELPRSSDAPLGDREGVAGPEVEPSRGGGPLGVGAGLRLPELLRRPLRRSPRLLERPLGLQDLAEGRGLPLGKLREERLELERAQPDGFALLVQLVELGELGCRRLVRAFELAEVGEAPLVHQFGVTR